MLESLAAEAGLIPEDAFDFRYTTFVFADAGALGRALLSPGIVTEVLKSAGEDAVRSALVDSLAPYRKPDGSYRLVNEWHYLVARA